MFYPKLVAFALYALPALAAPFPLLQVARTQNPISGRYVVTLKQGISGTVNPETFSSIMSPASNITHWWEPMNAFAGDFLDDDLETLRADPRIDAIEEDGIMTTLASANQYAPPPAHCSALEICTDVRETSSGSMLRGA